MPEETETFNEKRLFARIQGNFKISLSQGGGQIEVPAIDLSLSGLRFRSPRNIPLFREVALSLDLKEPDKVTELTCNGIIVRSEKGDLEDYYNIALTFIDLSDQDKNHLALFLEKFQNRQTK
ncbi:MAG: PilZ domain-containing protein [Candidatus Aureabacteria bacterium]|nr:PilZ domain-containing protein [Candidatus Auribacterota bacterium]